MLTELHCIDKDIVRQSFAIRSDTRAKFDDHIALTRATPASVAKYLSNLCCFKRSTP